MMRHIRIAYTVAVSGGLRLDARTGFQRSFLIFMNEDSGYEAGQKPSGHVKQEVREGKGKLYAQVQNLRPGNGRFAYGLYLLRNGKDGVITVCAGQLAPEPNKAELEWSFDPRNVGGSGYSIEEFDSAVVLVEYADRPADTVICPLAAYKNKKVEWRSGLRTAIQKKKIEAGNEFKKVQPIAQGMYNNSADSYAAAQWQQMKQPQVPPLQMEYMQEQKTNQMPQTLQTFPLQTQELSEFMLPQEETMNQQLPLEEGLNPLLPQEEPTQKQPLMPQISQEDLLQKQPLIPQMPQEELLQEQVQIPQMQTQETVTQPSQEQANVQYQGVPGQVDTGCVYLNGNMCGAFVNSGTSVANPCDACRMHHGQTHLAAPPAGDVIRLKEELDRYFEESDPFHSKRSDYMWWKVANPVNLNNLLYQCNIRSPLLFNPVVMMAHYKYRHLIIGIFQHKARQKQYVVCGVPGMHMVDRKPFGEMSRWVQMEGNRPKYGAFGYWLVYINPDDGKILNMSQE